MNRGQKWTHPFANLKHLQLWRSLKWARNSTYDRTTKQGAMAAKIYNIHLQYLLITPAVDAGLDQNNRVIGFYPRETSVMEQGLKPLLVYLRGNTFRNASIVARSSSVTWDCIW